MLAKLPIRVDTNGNKYPFCPGKATWYPQMDLVFKQCLVAKETGILPEGGTLEDQSQLFYDCFHTFIEKYKWRWYGRVWEDVGDVIPKVLEAVGKMFSGKK